MQRKPLPIKAGFAKVGGSVLRINICGEKRQLLVAVKHYAQC